MSANPEKTPKTRYQPRRPLFQSLEDFPASALIHELVRRHDIAVIYLYKNKVLGTQEGEVNLGIKCPPGDIYRVRKPVNFILDEQEAKNPQLSYFDDEGRFVTSLL